MRRILLLLVTLLVAGCGGEASLPIGLGAARSDVLRVADPTGVSIVDTDAAEVVARIPGGVRSRDWVFEDSLTATGTRITAVSGWGEVAWHTDLARDLALRIASSDGSRLALLPHSNAVVDPYHPAGRSTTRLTVVSTRGDEPREYVLDGNYEPEAFATSGRSLFVVEYLPPMQPDRYRVRKLDLDSGEVGAVYSVDGHLQESMRGTARVQALSADGSRLYTLYTTDAPSASHASETTAFVHVLDLDEEWAHCVDLPTPIGSSPSDQLALTASPAGDRVVVVDAMAGVAELDTDALTITRSVEHVVDPSAPGWAMAVLGRDGQLFTGRGTSVTVLDERLSYSHAWTTPQVVAGLYLDPGRPSLWALGTDAIHELDPATGRYLRSVPLPDDVPPIETPPAPQVTPIQCAC